MTSGGSDRPGDVLAQPTRARLFAHLARLGRPAGTTELAAEVGLHPSGVRVHLRRLEAAGLVTRERSPQSVGRPLDSWSVAVDALPGAEPPDAYRQLARWLARSTPPSPVRLREVKRGGRELGRELAAPSVDAPAQEAMGRILTSLGCAPQREPEAKERVVFRLGNCPYSDAIRANQPVVCALHHGLTLGLLDQLAPRALLIDFVPKDPDRAGCLIEVGGL